MNVKRFYRNELPEQNEMVMVKVLREDEEFGYYCELLEYNGVEGFLPLSELVKTKYAKKHILKPDQILPMSISKVDGNNINLTKKRVTNEESDLKKESYKICTDINKFINECYIMYKKNNINNDILDIESFMDLTIWKLYEDNDSNYLKVYQDILHKPNSIITPNIFTNDLIDLAINDINKRISFTNKIVVIDIKLIILETEPISKIKQILNLDSLKLDYNIKVIVMTSPFYKIKIEGDFEKLDIDIINKIKNHIINNSKNIKSIVNISDPKVEKEATCKFKYYADYVLENFSF